MKNRQMVQLKDTGKLSFSGERIYSADAGPYKFVCQNEDFVEIGGRLEKVRSLHWCSRDGEPIKPINADKFDIQEEIK